MASSATRTFKFIEAPPERSMRKKSPESAPRLFEWLVDNGYAEPVTSYRSGRGPSGRASSGGGGRLGAGKKKKKRSPF
jgi:hypothetical protein